jgi:hypothetical protein
MVRVLSRVPILALLAVLLLPAIAFAETVREGTSPGGGFYRIVVPDSWNGDLVIWNHGFDLDVPGPVTDMGPLFELQLAQGFAVAASSYRLPGWAVFKTDKDLKAMVNAFVGELGPPQRILVYGASLGGIVTARAIERARLGNVVGALTYCGAMAGSRNWDAAIDLRLLYDWVCRGVPAAAIPGGGEGLPKNTSFSQRDLEEAVNACTGVLRKKAKRTPAQKQRLAALLDATGLPEEFLLPSMGYATFGMSDLIHDRRKLRGRQGPGNAEVDYGDAAIDAGIERVTPHRGGARKLRKSYTPKGGVGNVKIVAMHTDKDGLVLVENESVYASVVPPANLTVAIAVEKRPSHCGFTPAEALAGWETLLDWVGGAPQPGAADIQRSCQELTLILPGPCRIDPAFVLPDPDGRVRPR